METHTDESLNQWLRLFKEVAMNDVDSVGGYAVPVDPMDDLMCESCQ